MYDAQLPLMYIMTNDPVYWYCFYAELTWMYALCLVCGLVSIFSFFVYVCVLFCLCERYVRD